MADATPPPHFLDRPAAILRMAFYGGSSALILLAVLLVPMPLFTFSPGGATSVPGLIQIDTDVTEINGDFGLLTVTVRQPTIAELVRSRMTGDDIRRVEEVLPSGVDRRQYFDQQEQLFDQTFHVAVTVGLQATGADVELRTAPVVVDVVEDAPAAGILQPGDLVQSILGVEVATADDLIETGSALRDGQPVPLVVERDGEVVEVVVNAGRVRGMQRPGLGISLDTLVIDFDYPFEITLDPDVTIGGPSAGLMMALSVYDLIAEEDLARGRVVVGTGTINLAGEVGPIGSIEQKVETAVAAGADVFLAPASQVDRAIAVAPPGLRVVSVATLQDALNALRDGDGLPA